MSRFRLLAAAVATLLGSGLLLGPAPAQAATWGVFVFGNTNTVHLPNGITDTMDYGNTDITLVNTTTGDQYPVPAYGQGFNALAVPFGTYKIRIYYHGVGSPFTVWWSNVQTQTSASPLTFVNNDQACYMVGACSTQIWADPEVWAPAPVTVHVKNSDGSPAAGKVVTATRQADVLTGTTGADGNAVLTVLPGTWTFSTPNGNTTAATTAGTGYPSSNVTVQLASTPTSPRNAAASAASHQASITWDPPLSDGGKPVTGYQVVASPGGSSCSTATTGCTITGLSNNTSYTFTVRASNGVGWSAWSSPSNPVTPLDPPPSAPTNVAATAGDQQATVSWSPPATGGDTVIGYQVTSTPGGAVCSTVDLSCTVTGLTNAQAYTFAVVASSSGGTGPAAVSNAVIPLAPKSSSPTNVAAVADNEQATVSWRPPTDGAQNVTGYSVFSVPGNMTCSTTSLSCDVKGLTNGQAYTFVVVAHAPGGDSPASAPSNPVTPVGRPSAPRNVDANPGDGSALVTWDAPADDGGLAITAYTVTAWPGGKTCNTTGARTCLVQGLVNDQQYVFTVVATNTAGDSEASPASAPVTPRNNTPAPSPDLKVYPKGPYAKPNTPLTAKWHAAGADQVSVQWATANGSAASLSAPTAPITAKPHAQATLPKLGPGGAWQITVTSYDANGNRLAQVTRNLSAAFTKAALSRHTSAAGKGLILKKARANSIAVTVKGTAKTKTLKVRTGRTVTTRKITGKGTKTVTVSTPKLAKSPGRLVLKLSSGKIAKLGLLR